VIAAGQASGPPRCHAVSGAHTDLRFAIRETGSITGTVMFRQLFTETAWFPMTSVTLRGADPAEGAGLRLVRFPSPADSAAVHLVWPPHQTRWWDQRRVPLDQPVRFALRWQPHQLEVRLPPDETWTPVDLTFAPTELVLGCTSSDVHFDAVLDGRPLPASP